MAIPTDALLNQCGLTYTSTRIYPELIFLMQTPVYIFGDERWFEMRG
jgi:hypothetical protein